jgi:hypothetical protein
VPCLGWRPKHTDAGECWGGCGSGLGRKGGGGDTQHGYLPPFSLAFSRSVCFRMAPYNYQGVSVWSIFSGCFRMFQDGGEQP